MWEFAVPLDRDENSINGFKSAAFSAEPSPNAFASRNALSSHTNVSNQPSRSIEIVSMPSTKASNLSKTPNEVSNATDPDSLLDLYKPASNNTSRAVSGAATKVLRKKPSKLGTPSANTPEEDANNWIHRDKLAQIESRELEDFRVGRRVSERVESGLRDKRQRLTSPVRVEDEEEYDPYREESTSGAIKSFLPKPAAGRPGGSRIPVPRSVSSSITQSEQDSSGQGTRSRTGSNGWAANAADQSPQSQPSTNGSGNECNQQHASPPTSPVKTNDPLAASNIADRSPTKARTPVKALPAAAGARKVTPGAQRQPSSAGKRNTTPSKSPPEPKRPGTSSGYTNSARPTTSHRPEGDPPWIATMYKPDPRLPPDQQMLPTHAKRMAQAQWEKEGKTGTIYDREFRLLNTEAFPANSTPGSQRSSRLVAIPLTSTEGDRIQQTTLSTRWPLADSPPLGSPRSQSSARPGTSGTEHGGYKTIPSISKPHGSAALNSPSIHKQTLRLPNAGGESEKQTAGCCACIVM